MPALDFLKRKPKEDEKKKEERKEEKKERKKLLKSKKGIEIYSVLKSPHITEKATDLARKNQYVFRVWPKANKPQIKKAIEDLYKVKVVSVKIINTPPKRRRIGRISGWRPKFKKAIVKIKEGQKIEILPR
ncbi:50S ribosomal protein L23 [bacterium]|nr:50S ribosomal protein L23 [bacterium]